MGELSGGPIKLSRGWALIPFIGSKAHFWVEQEVEPYIDKNGRVRFYTSLCGIEATTDDKVPALEPGNWKKCKRCIVMKDSL